MKAPTALLLVLAATAATAAEDLALLPPTPGPQALGAMLETWLKEQAYAGMR